MTAVIYALGAVVSLACAFHLGQLVERVMPAGKLHRKWFRDGVRYERHRRFVESKRRFDALLGPK